MFWLVLLVAVAVGVLVVRRSIAEIESGDHGSVQRVGFSDRWNGTTRAGKAAFIVMALGIIVWIGLILFIPLAIAMGAVAWMVWSRPSLARPLGRVVLWSGIALALLETVDAFLRAGGDQGVGATVTNLMLVPAPVIVIGVLLMRSGTSKDSEPG